MITLTDKYLTRSGLTVTVYAVDAEDTYPVLAVVHTKDGDMVVQYRKDGTISSNQNEFDLIKVRRYDHIKLDDPVIVWDHGGQKFNRHFAGIKYGKHAAWDDGKTSWTAEGEYTTWDECELA